jgi:hypothetical protein
MNSHIDPNLSGPKVGSPRTQQTTSTLDPAGNCAAMAEVVLGWVRRFAVVLTIAVTVFPADAVVGNAAKDTTSVHAATIARRRSVCFMPGHPLSDHADGEVAALGGPS